MKSTLLLAATVLAISTTTQAYPPKPDKCPTAADVQSAGIHKEMVVQDWKKQWVVVGMLSAPYNTDNNWSFQISGIDAANEDDAFNQAAASLTSLKNDKGPMPLPKINRWGCTFTTQETYTGIAITPTLMGNASGILNSAN
jgi:hypothetical protein